MKSQNRDDIALESALRGPYYKNHLFMGWYFSRRELGYGSEITISTKEFVVKLPVISISIVAYTAIAAAFICYANL